MQMFDKVKLNFDHNRLLTDDMISWMEEHKTSIFKIEKISDESVKLFKINFWITKDLLILL